MNACVWKKAALRIATLLWIGFIFWNSLHVASASSEMSGSLLELLTRIPVLHALTDHIVRKCAHFIEFFLLGGLLTASLRPGRTAVRGAAALPFFFCLIVPLVDETIQLVVPGRSGQVSDVLLDFSGALCGLLLVSALLHRFAPLRAAAPRQWNRKRAAVLAVLVLLCLGFIWGNSALPGAVSRQQSNVVYERVAEIAAPAVQERFLRNDFWVRKAAHFAEFGCLGLLLTALSAVLLGRTREALFAAASGGLLAAVLDEGIQLLTGSRTAQVRDVWIDFGGLIAGGIVLLLLLAALRRARRD